MATAFDPALLPPSAQRTVWRARAKRVLPQYFRSEYHPLWPLAKIAFFLTGVVLAMFTGLFVALGGTLALKFVGFPIGIFIVLIIWLLPDVDRPANPPFWKLFTAYLTLAVVWPAYIAVVIPGLPWLTPPRIVFALLILVMMAHLPQYAQSRARVWNLLAFDTVAFRLYAGFLLIAVALIPFSKSPVETLSSTLLQETFSLAPVVATAWIAHDPERVARIWRLLLLCCIGVLLVAVLENWMQSPPWANYIPSFMQIDPNVLELILSPQSRAGDWRYRVRSVFPVVLYYTQYLNLMIPLFLYALVRMRGRKMLLVPPLLLLLLHSVWFANARTAFIPFFLSAFAIAALVITREIFFRGRRDTFKTSLLVGGVLLAVLLLGGALASSHRLKMYTFGGGQHTASNETRDQQWDNAVRQIKKNPIGVGIGNSPELVGTFSSKTPFPVVDSLWINMLVDVGIVGFALFFGFFLRSAWIGVKTFMRSDGELEDMAGIMAISLGNFVISAYVISHARMNYLAIVMAVCIFTLARRQQERLGLAAQPEQPALPAAGTALATR
jgi:hypothetical protein